MSGNWDHSTTTATTSATSIVKSETMDFHYPLDLTCNVTTSAPIRGQTIPFTIQPLENKSTKSTVGLQPMITGCSLTSSPTSSSSSLEHEDEAAAAAMGYHPTGTISQLSIFRRQTNNPLQVIHSAFMKNTLDKVDLLLKNISRVCSSLEAFYLVTLATQKLDKQKPI